MLNGGTATYTATTIASPATKALPSMTTLDTFIRANANNLGANWTQPNNSGVAALRVNTNQAFCTNVILSGIVVRRGSGLLERHCADWTDVPPEAGCGLHVHQHAGDRLESVPGRHRNAVGERLPERCAGAIRDGSGCGHGSDASSTRRLSPFRPERSIPNTANNSQNDTLNFTGNRVLVSTTTNPITVERPRRRGDPDRQLRHWQHTGRGHRPDDRHGRHLEDQRRDDLSRLGWWSDFGLHQWLAASECAAERSRVDDFKGGTVP